VRKAPPSGSSEAEGSARTHSRPQPVALCCAEECARCGRKEASLLLVFLPHAPSHPCPFGPFSSGVLGPQSAILTSQPAPSPSPFPTPSLPSSFLRRPPFSALPFSLPRVSRFLQEVPSNVVTPEAASLPCSITADNPSVETDWKLLTSSNSSSFLDDIRDCLVKRREGICWLTTTLGLLPQQLVVYIISFSITQDTPIFRVSQYAGACSFEDRQEK